MARSIKNTFAPINRVPPDVLSLIPDYFEDEADEEPITLAHVCRHWREIFTSRGSLWTFLDCMDLDKTRVYLERSKASPLEILIDEDFAPSPDDALLLTVPHLGRLKSLALSGSSDYLLSVTKYFDPPAPILEELEIRITHARPVTIENTLFGRNLPSLRNLYLSGIVTDLPWQNLANLRTFDFRQVPRDKISVTKLLDFFEHAPLLCEIALKDSLPASSDAPSERVVSLPYLKLLRILTQTAHLVLLSHLHIPTGALVSLKFKFFGEEFPIPDYFPKSIDNLNNISHVTSVGLNLSFGMDMRLSGPREGLYVLGTWAGGGFTPAILDDRIPRTLNKFPISTAERFTLVQCDAPIRPETEESTAYRTLSLMNDLHTLTLVDYPNLSFIFALNPDLNASNTVLCPKLEEIVLYIREMEEGSCVESLLEMAKGRDSRGAKLKTIVIVCEREFIPAEKVFGRRRYVPCVEYRLQNTKPVWDTLSEEIHKDFHDFDW